MAHIVKKNPFFDEPKVRPCATDFELFRPIKPDQIALFFLFRVFTHIIFGQGSVEQLRGQDRPF